MKQFTRSITLSIALVAPCFAQDEYPTFVTSEAVLDMQTTSGRHTDAVRDIVVDPFGRLTSVLFDSGVVRTYDALDWDAAAREFTTAVPTSSPGKRRPGKRRPDAPSLLLSKLAGLPIHGPSAEDGGPPEKIATAGGAVVDVRSGHVAFVTTSVGGVFGIGAESKVIPFDAFEVRRDQEGAPVFVTSISQQRLGRAPTLGEDFASLDNPPYRDSIYSYFGVDRPDYDPRVDGDDQRGVLTLSKIVGTPVGRGDGDEDTIENLILDPKTGAVSDALLTSGQVVPIARLRWHTDDERFTIAQQGESERDNTPRGERLLATALRDMRVLASDGQSVSGVGELYFDTEAGNLAYMTIDQDGVRVLPWSLVDVGRSQARELTIKLPKSVVADAPELDGSVGASIYSSSFRSRVAQLEPRDR